MQEGTQLSFWNDVPANEFIVFDGTYCYDDCPSNEIYQARGRECTIFVQPFSSNTMWEPSKWLITILKDFPRFAEDRTWHCIEDDIWKAFSKIKELTGRTPTWRLFLAQENIPPNRC